MVAGLDLHEIVQEVPHCHWPLNILERIMMYISSLLLKKIKSKFNSEIYQIFCTLTFCMCLPFFVSGKPVLENF